MVCSAWLRGYAIKHCLHVGGVGIMSDLATQIDRSDLFALMSQLLADLDPCKTVSLLFFGS